MPSYMNAQKLATKRNALAEMLVDFTLQRFVDKLYEDEYILEQAETETQKDFVREDCSDCFDHYVKLHLSPKIDPACSWLEIWGQTTCYKGSPSGKPESNKTYEIRETLVEALTLRKWLRNENVAFRTLHFTLGPAQYTYGWFKSAKEKAFDLSLYPESDPAYDIFSEIFRLADGMVYQYEFTEKLNDLMANTEHPLSRFVNSTVAALYNYFVSGMPSCEMANAQSDLLQQICNATEGLMPMCVEASVNAGMNIKGMAVNLLHGEVIDDPILMTTLQRILTNNPFLDEALKSLGEWDSWSVSAFNRPSARNSLLDYMKDLWSDESSKKYVIRRLMLRVYTSEGIDYIQDLNVAGIDEHNLYSGTHSATQVAEICAYLHNLYLENGISTTSALYSALTSARAKALVNTSLKFEGINGTNLKPSFYYLEEYLKPEYELVSFAEAELPEPVAYYTHFAPDLNIQQYDNLKVVRRVDTGKSVAIIKGKFFRKPEFPRRAKEEAYVGVTASFDLQNNQFEPRYPRKPLIMFVDMQDSWTPPAFALKRLIGYGWYPFFQLGKLKEFLDSISGGDSYE